MGVGYHCHVFLGQKLRKFKAVPRLVISQFVLPVVRLLLRSAAAVSVVVFVVLLLLLLKIWSLC